MDEKKTVNTDTDKNAPMKKNPKQEAFAAWNLLDEGITIEAIASKLQITEDMVIRWKTVLDGLREKLTDEQISKKLGNKWTKRVTLARRWYPEYESCNPVVSNNIKKLVDKLHARIINPNVIEQFYLNNSLWFFGGEDWRLVPNIWLRLVIPDLEAWPKWTTLYKNLQQHEITKELFKSYEELIRMTNALQKDLDEAVKKISKKDPDFNKIWDSVIEQLGDYAFDSIKPSRQTAYSPDEIIPLPYLDPEFSGIMLEAFKTKIPDLMDRYDPIEQQLQKVCDELDKIRDRLD